MRAVAKAGSSVVGRPLMAVAAAVVTAIVWVSVRANSGSPCSSSSVSSGTGQVGSFFDSRVRSREAGGPSGCAATAESNSGWTARFAERPADTWATARPAAATAWRSCPHICRTSTAHVVSRRVGVLRISLATTGSSALTISICQAVASHSDVVGRLVGTGRFVASRNASSARMSASVPAGGDASTDLHEAVEEPAGARARRGPIDLVLARLHVARLHRGDHAAGVEQDVDQPAGPVEAPPHPVVGPPGALVEGAEVVELDAGELLLGGAPCQVQLGARVVLDLDEVDALLDVGADRQDRTLGDVQVEEAQCDPVRILAEVRQVGARRARPAP